MPPSYSAPTARSQAAGAAGAIAPTRARYTSRLGSASRWRSSPTSTASASRRLRRRCAASSGLTAIQMGWAFSVFGWAYALFEMPGGWLGDRLGARRVLMRIVIWWSFFTAATGWVWNTTSLIVTRTLFGAGEAGAFPNMTRIFTTWLPGRERERAQAILWLASRWGGALTPLLVAYILQFMSWRRAFELFGALGVIWAVVFYRWYRDDPGDAPDR